MHQVKKKGTYDRQEKQSQTNNAIQGGFKKQSGAKRCIKATGDQTSARDKKSLNVKGNGEFTGEVGHAAV